MSRAYNNSLVNVPSNDTVGILCFSGKRDEAYQHRPF